MTMVFDEYEFCKTHIVRNGKVSGTRIGSIFWLITWERVWLSRYRAYNVCFTNSLGTASKPNRRLTGGSGRFRPVSIVRNNDNRPEPDGTAGQPAVGFWSLPLLNVLYTPCQISPTGDYALL